MAGFDENIVREYFELNGFLVRQARKYQVQSRQKRADEEVDLLVLNPLAAGKGPPESFQLFSGDLSNLHRAMVVVKGWHTSTFTPRMLKSGKGLFDFLKKEVIDSVADFFGEEKEQQPAFRKILVLPALPTSDPHRSESLRLLKENGVDGVISFRTILENLVARIEVNHSYQKSETLHVLRLLKMYEMLRSSQLSLFPEDS